MNQPVVVRQTTIDKVLKNVASRNELDISIDFTKAVRSNGHTCVDVLCNTCGTIKHRHNIETLSKHTFSCKTCLVDKYKELCSAINRKYLSHVPPIKNGGKTVVTTMVESECNVCTDRAWTASCSLTAGNKVLCQNCLTIKYKEQAATIKSDYIGREGKRLMLRCHAHGHLFNIVQSSEVNAGDFCEECKIVGFKEHLASKDCSFLEMTLRADENGCLRKVVHYRNNQGDLFTATRNNINKRQFATTVDGQWHNKHSTYLIRLEHNGFVYCKIGTAQVPEDRMKYLRLIGDAEVFTLESFDDRFAATKLESELHREFKPLRVHKALAAEFTTKTVRAKRVGQTERVHIKDGCTEWFTSEVFPILASRYNLTKDIN